ncbi:MAG: fibronectin type III domain-containing protein [Deltaproteobacteria bacterium]|nr:fibronectin type III domain-containing protein [Deltaproteobacteria bacterium]
MPNILVHILRQPSLTDILPVDGKTLATNSAQITWQTDVTGTAEVYYRVAGTTEYHQITGDPGNMHRIVIDNLTWDKTYEWYAVTGGLCAASQTATATFFIKDGVVFEQKERTFQISRDYDQPVTMTIQNRDVFAHTVLVEVINPYDDFVTGFIGTGSVDESLTLEAGQVAEITLANHAQDTRLNQYTLTLKLYGGCPYRQSNCRLCQGHYKRCGPGFQFETSSKPIRILYFHEHLPYH